MRLPVILAVSVVAAAAVSCRPDTVELAYSFREGDILRYRLEAEARAEWDIEGEGSGFYRVVFAVTEEVEDVDDTGAIVALDLRRLDAEENNFPVPQDSSFTVRVDAHGAVTDVLEVGGVEASELSPEERSTLRTYRTLLALQPVELGEQWPASQEFQGAEFESIDVTGTLEALNRDEKGRFAELSYRGRGPLIDTRQLPQGDAQLDGRSRTRGRATMDLDGGFLRASTSSTEYDYDVRVIGEGAGNTVTGDLHLELDLSLRKL
jgi:hypothetical protein